MGDRAPASVTIHECPPEAEASVAGVLAEFGFTEDGFHDPECGPWSRDWLGQPWVSQEIELGAEQAIGRRLADLGCAFVVHQLGKSEYDGVVFMHAPGLGTYEGRASNSDGAVLVGADEIDGAVEDTPSANGASPELVQRLAKLTAKPWRDLFATLTEQRASW